MTVFLVSDTGPNFQINSGATFPSVSFYYKDGFIFSINMDEFENRNWEKTKELLKQHQPKFLNTAIEAREELIRIGQIRNVSNIQLDKDMVDQMMYDYLANKDELSIIALEDYLKENGVPDKDLLGLLSSVKARSRIPIEKFLLKYCRNKS